MSRFVFHVLGLILLLGTEPCFAQIVINEIQASNEATIADVDGDSSDWIELLNVSNAPYDIGDHALSDDPDDPRKWVFPSFIIPPGERLIVWCSGKNLRFPTTEQLLANDSAIEVRPTMLDLDHPWRYLTALPESGDPPTGWHQTNFLESRNWQLGIPGFGFGDDDDRTELESGIGAVFLRTNFDVQDIGPGTNVALNGVATQSSQFEDWEAGRAIDGNTDGDGEGGNSVSLTDGENSWWEIDLQAVHDISYIKLWNRLDCCSYRLTNFTVTVFNEDRGKIYERSFLTDDSGVLGPCFTIDGVNAAGSLEGRFVRISMPGSNLSLAEVEIFSLEPNVDLEGMVLQINYDDGFVAWLNGTRVLSVNFPENEEPTFNSNATRSREARRVQRWMVPEWASLLRPENNLLAVALLNRTHRSNDLSFMPEIGFSDPTFHTNFQLDSDGELLLLTSPGREILDGIEFPRQTEDRSYGRVPDGSGLFNYLFYPTPGEVNDDHTSQQPIASSVSFSPPPGYHTINTRVNLSANIPFDDFDIRYTTNGSPPTSSSQVFSGPLTIAQDTVIRAAGFLDGRMIVDPAAGTYFVRRSRPSLPVLSISMNAADFSNVHNNSGGRGRGSEREAHLEIFNDEGQQVIQTGFGIRLHGGAGRGGGFNIKKAYKAYFRGVYGETKLRYPLIPDTDLEVFDKLVLRSNFNDAIGRNGNGSLLRDQLIRDLHKDMGGFISHGAWYHMFVNAQYRGIYNVVERMDEEFMKDYFPEEGSDWDVMKTGDDVLVGSNQEWNRIATFMGQNNLSSNDAYNAFGEFVDIENFTSYMIVNIWAQNHDWPHNNWYASRSRSEGGKWRFFCWDAEFGISLSPGGYSSNTVTHALNGGGRLAEIFRALSNNLGYRRYFTDEVERYLNGPLSPANTRRRLDELRQRVMPDIQDELSLVGSNRNQWDRNISTMYTFLSNRNGPFMGHVRAEARLSPPPDMTPNVRSVTPAEIVNTGDVVVRVRGLRLVRNIQIFFNGVEAEVISYHGIIGGVSVRVPFDGALVGPVTVRARNPDADVESEETGGLFTVSLPEPLVTGIQPATGPAAGGQKVFLSGGYFLEGVTVFFGDQEAPSALRFGPNADSTVLIEVTTPPGQGEVEVRAVNTIPGRSESVDSAIFTYENAEGYTRGDADSGGDINLTDAVQLLNFLFSGGAEPACAAAADTNRSGSIDMTDAIQILNFLFLGAENFPAPFPGCGQDPLGELLDCDTTRNCQ
ncbi:MAG: CotH kinase family protein [Planctomycetota bacterium]|nr:CotH kinase family protein [Planctomycetota bacterium]